MRTLVKKLNSVTVQFILVGIYFPIIGMSWFFYTIIEKKEGDKKSYWKKESLPNDKKYFTSPY